MLNGFDMSWQAFIYKDLCHPFMLRRVSNKINAVNYNALYALNAIDLCE